MPTIDSQGPGRQIESNTPLHDILQLSKITKKNNHVPYNMRCWRLCPPSATYFWHLFRKCTFTQINSISDIQSISRLILAFNSPYMCVWGGGCDFYLGGTWKIKCMQRTPHIRKIESGYQAWNGPYFGTWINPCKCTFLKRCQKMKKDNISNISCYKVRDYFSL